MWFCFMEFNNTLVKRLNMFCVQYIFLYLWILWTQLLNLWKSVILKLEIYEFIILSCDQHRCPWPSFATPPYGSSLPAGPQGYTPYHHRAAECRFELVVLPILGHVKGYIGVHHLWVRPYFSSSVLLVLLV